MLWSKVLFYMIDSIKAELKGARVAWPWAHNRYQTIVAPGVKQLYLHRFCMKGCTVII